MPRTSKQFEEIRVERREAILDAALHVFAEEGYGSATINKISQRAGVSKGLMYNYFDSKEALLELLIGSLLDEETALIQELMQNPFNEDVFIQLIKMGTTILKKSPKKWKLYMTMATHPTVLSILEKRYVPEKEMYMKYLLKFFADKGHKDPLLQVHFFSTTMTGFKFNYIMDPENCPIDELETMIIKQFINHDYVSNSNK